jgi:predicted restriction endonuclease
MAKDLWTREELLLALNLYYKIPFGQFDHRNPKVVELAKLIGRTPSSVAMQLSNFAGLDPYHHNRGIKGLRPPGKLAQKLWAEAQNDWNNIVLESEKLLEILTQTTVKSETEKEISPEEIFKLPAKMPDGPTEAEYLIRVRLGQKFFRAIIIANYRERCCVCGIPIPELLIASHIIPWKEREDLRLNPHNGLCLCALHDKAFDKGFITIDSTYTVIISPTVYDYLPQEALNRSLIAYQNHKISLPDRFLPDKGFLEVHQRQHFMH